MVRHSVHSIKYASVTDGIAMNLGIQLTLMLFKNGLGAAIGTEYDMIDEIAVAHNVAKVHIISEMCKCVLGSPSATRLAVIQSPCESCSLAALAHLIYRGLLGGSPFGRLH